MSDFSPCFINVKRIVHPKIKMMPSVDSVMVFYFYTIIYSNVVLNLSEFLSSAERKCYFEEQGKPNSLLILGDFHIFPSIKVNVDQQLFGYPDSPNILFCVQHKKEMNTVWDNMRVSK